MPNPMSVWIDYVRIYHSKHPNISYRQALTDAAKSKGWPAYRKKHGKYCECKGPKKCNRPRKGK